VFDNRNNENNATEHKMKHSICITSIPCVKPEMPSWSTISWI